MKLIHWLMTPVRWFRTLKRWRLADKAIAQMYSGRTLQHPVVMELIWKWEKLWEAR